MALVVAIDAGTTGVRSLLLDKSGHIVDLSYRELTQYFPQPGWVEHDPQEIWTAVVATLQDVGAVAANRGEAVSAIGITNQRETTVAWDRKTGAFSRAVVWQDRRTADRCDALRDAGHLPMIRARTGLVLDSYFSATKMEWLLTAGGVRATPDLALGTVDSWVLWNLTGGTQGGVFATDATNASRTLLYDIVERAWSAELCELFGVPVASLAEVRPSCGRLGVVSGAGIDPPLRGAPVSGMAGDQHTALFGQACFEPGMAKVTYGTGSFVLENVGKSAPAPPEGLVSTLAWDLAEHGGVAYALEGSAFVSGAAIQWLRDGLGIIERAEQLGPLAETVPDSGGVTFVPAFTGLGSPWWDPRARGTITGLTRGSGRAQIARAVVEAMAFQVRDMVDAMTKATGEPLSCLRADGGASAMELLLHLQANQLNVPVARPKATESTALGATTLAGLAEGVWGSLDEPSSLWELDVETTPDLPREIVDAQHASWLRAVDRARSWA